MYPVAPILPSLIGLALTTAPAQAAAADVSPPAAPPSASSPPPAKPPSGAALAQPPAPSQAAATSQPGPAQVDTAPAPEENTRPAPSEAKPWAVGLDYEFHHAFASQTLDAGAPKTYQGLLLRGRVSVTRHDEIALAAGVLQAFLAYTGGSSVRAGDIALRYTHRFDLPGSFQLAASVSATAPTSYWSQLASNITVPGASLALSREFGDLALSLSAFGHYYWNRYPSESTPDTPNNPGTGMVNLSSSAGGMLSAAFAMPFLRGLSVGARFVGVSYWYDSPGSTSSTQAIGYPGGTFVGASAASAPQPEYGLDLHVTYATTFDVLALSMTAGVGNTTTWLSRLDDVAQRYFFGPEQFDAYVALGAAL
jgi:hypothetical protein